MKKGEAKYLRPLPLSLSCPECSWSDSNRGLSFNCEDCLIFPVSLLACSTITACIFHVYLWPLFYCIFILLLTSVYLCLLTFFNQCITIKWLYTQRYYCSNNHLLILLDCTLLHHSATLETITCHTSFLTVEACVVSSSHCVCEWILFLILSVLSFASGNRTLLNDHTAWWTVSHTFLASIVSQDMWW